MADLHRVAIKALCAINSGLTTRSFCHQLSEALGVDLDDVQQFSLRPDAHYIDINSGIVSCVEVEYTSRVTSRKWGRYQDLFAFLDDLGWSLFVITYDYMGNQCLVVSNEDFIDRELDLAYFEERTVIWPKSTA